MKILVTGCAGYLGSILTEALLHRNHQVVGVDSLMYGGDGLLHCCAWPTFEFHKVDVRDAEQLASLANTCDAVTWLAAIVGAPACEQNKNDSININYYAVRDFLARINYNCLFIYPNTNSGYGIGGSGKCVETQLLEPISRYGKQKILAEQLVLQHGRYVVFRFATLFGASPRMRRDLMVNDFVFKACDDGVIVLYEPHFRRNFLHVRDAARVIISAIEGEIATGNIYNVGLDDANLTKLELCERIKRWAVPDLDIVISDTKQDPDRRDYIVSNDKILATGWRPQFLLEQGITELIKCNRLLKRRGEYANI